MFAPSRPGASPWVQVALMPWRRALRREPAIALALLLLSMLLLPAVLRAFGAGRVAGLLAAVLAGVMLLVVWCSFVSGLLRQNLPAAARLVPGQLRQLRLVLLGAWALMALGQALVSTLWFGHGLVWHLSAALLLVGAAVTVRVPALWLLVWLLPAFSWWWTQLPVVRWATSSLMQLCNDSPLTATLATLALGSMCLPALLQGGGVAHRLSQAQREARSRSSTGGKGAVDAPNFPLPVWLRRGFTALYRRLLTRLCQRPHSPVMARAMLALGPQAHWTRQLTVAAILLAFAAGVLALLYINGVLPVQGFKRSHLLGAAIGLMSFALSPLPQLNLSMFNRRREQALLALLPGMPRAAALNHAIARHLMLQFLVAWGLAATAALWLVGGTPGSGPVIQAVVWGSLPFGLLLWRDWSRMRPPGGLRTALQVAAMVATVLLLATVTRNLDVGGWPLAMLSLGVTLALGAWRWRAVSRAPSAWPAARAGQGAVLSPERPPVRR